MLDGLIQHMHTSAHIADIPVSIFPEGWQFHQTSRDFGHWLITQPQAAQLLYRWCGEPWFQALFKSDLLLLQRFLTETQASAEPAYVVQRSLMAHVWFAWWRATLEHDTRATFETHVTITGLERLQALYQQKQGVILVSSHNIFALLNIFLLKHYEFTNQTIIGRAVPALQSQGRVVDRLGKTFIHLQQLYAAQTTLQTGGVVFILPDGENGKGGVQCNYYQRQRSFRTGFAEIALATGAVILPTLPYLDLSGQFGLTVCEPFDPGPPTMPHADRIRYLVEQYVAYLHAEWQKPWDIHIRRMAMHLALPTVEPGAPSST